MDIGKIYDLSSLQELEDYLRRGNESEIRDILLKEFRKYADYKNASGWNKAVRLCECLAIVGWGEHEPLQAVRGTFYNGNPETSFFDRYRTPHFVSAIWSKRKNGYTMEQGRTVYYASPLVPEKPTDKVYPVAEDIEDIKFGTQRNWIPKSPVMITRGIANCYESTREVIESIDNDLQSVLNSRMRPELYGNAVDRIILKCSFSFYDHADCKTNHIIADPALKLKQKDFYPALMKMHTEQEISENGYYLRNRYEYGSFKNGKIQAIICFEKELKDMTFAKQKEKISKHIAESLDNIICKLKKKKLDYDFLLMQRDFLDILEEWKEKVV